MSECLIDELALLFTGSHVPASFETTDRETVEEELDEAKGSGDVTLFPTPSDSHILEAPIPPTTPSTPIIRASSTPIIHSVLRKAPGDAQKLLFAIEQLGIDRRLIVNRKRQLKMYRVWIQGKFRKL